MFLVMGHPFNFELYEMIRGIMCGGFEFGITEPSNISLLRRLSEERDGVTQKLLGVEVMEIEEAVMNRLRISAKTAKNEINEPNIKYLSNKILQFLVGEKGSEVRIEAVDAGYIVKVGPPGAMEEFTRFTRMTGNTVVARLKALASMDLVERRKSQNGSFSVVWRSERYDLHLRTEVDDCGETLVLSLAA